MKLKNFLMTFSATCLLILSSTPANAADTVSLQVQNAEIKDVLQAAASISGKNIITDDTVKGRISINIHELPLTAALDIITAAKGLSYRKIDDVILVSSQENLTKYNNSVAAYKLNYVPAQDIAEPLKALFNNGKLTIDPLTNTILFTGSTAEEQRLRSALTALDVPSQQVTLEAKIIAVNREQSDNLGINWNWDTIPQRNEDHKSDNADSDNSSDNEYFGGSFKFWHGYTFNFNAALNALFADGKAKILATPRIITVPGKEASIFIGDHIPVQTEKHDSSGTYTATEYLDAGIKLSYTPIVSSDSKTITASVHTEVSTPTLVSEIRNYKITSRTADTNVRMRSGETLVIGGLINEEEQKSIQKIPLLSNIPLLGELFKNRTTRKVKTEVLMILTPYITEAGTSPAIYNQQLLETAIPQENIHNSVNKKAQDE